MEQCQSPNLSIASKTKEGSAISSSTMCFYETYVCGFECNCALDGNLAEYSGAVK